MRRISRLILTVAFVVPWQPMAAQATTDSKTTPLFTWRDAALVGGLTIMTAAVSPLDVAIAKRLSDSTVQTNRFLGRVAAVVRDVATPYSVWIGVSLYAYGRVADDKNAADLGLHGTEALLIGALTGSALKGFFGRERPYVKQNPHNYRFGRGFGRGREPYRSFPSGHTIAAFAAAAAVTSETRRWWRGSEWYVGPVLYGGAAMSGISRIYHNRHWASDVMMGAAIGILAGNKVVRYHHTHPDNLLDDWLLSASASRDAAGRIVLNWSLLPLVGR